MINSTDNQTEKLMEQSENKNNDIEVNQYIGGQKDLLDEKKGAVAKYKEMFLGNVSFFYFLKYEIYMLMFSWVPGALGFALRKVFFRSLFKKVGRGVVFGRNMTIRHPKKIEIGDNVIFDDNTVIDAKGEDNVGLKIGNNVLVGRNTSLSCKGGDIEIGDFSNIGPNNIIISESKLKIGKYVFTSGQVYMIAGGNHSFDRTDIPIWLQPSISKGGIYLDDDIWIGASSTILDGVRVGRGAIIGAATLVHKRIRPYTVNLGVPAQMIKKRD
jgi:acetyltransferase-like isoleucine patch superfamily enzyme